MREPCSDQGVADVTAIFFILIVFLKFSFVYICWMGEEEMVVILTGTCRTSLGWIIHGVISEWWIVNIEY